MRQALRWLCAVVVVGVLCSAAGAQEKDVFNYVAQKAAGKDH